MLGYVHVENVFHVVRIHSNFAKLGSFCFFLVSLGHFDGCDPVVDDCDVLRVQQVEFLSQVDFEVVPVLESLSLDDAHVQNVLGWN